jgi:hypothetical protein
MTPTNLQEEKSSSFCGYHAKSVRQAEQNMLSIPFMVMIISPCRWQKVVDIMLEKQPKKIQRIILSACPSSIFTH